MTSLASLLKKNYRIILSSIILIYLFFALTVTYILYVVLFNNALTITSLASAYFEQYKTEIEKKAALSRKIFDDVELKFIKGNFKNAFQADKYIRKTYLEKYDVSIINERGVINDTNNINEKGLDLSKFVDAKKSLIDAKSAKKLLVDYPVLGSDNKSFYIYLLKYIPEKKFYLQLGYKIKLLSDVLTSMTNVSLSKNYHFDLSVFHIYLDKDYNYVKLFGKHDEINRDVINALIKNSKDTLIIKRINDIGLFKIVAKNKSFALLYMVNIKPVQPNQLWLWVSINLLMLIAVFLLYKKYILIIKNELEKPLKQIKQHLNECKPYQYGGEIVELKEIAETYEGHLEKMKIRDFLKEVLSAQERERERIARDVHDTIIQNLNYLLIKLKQGKNGELSALLKEQIAGLRKLIIDSDIVLLKNLGIVKFLEILISECSVKNPDIKFCLENSLSNFEKISSEDQIHLVRIIRELINNAIKHSKGNVIELRIGCDNNKLHINVVDNGTGFDINNIDHSIHFGLTSVKERVYILKGDINISSNTFGTKVSVTVPLNQNINKKF